MTDTWNPQQYEKFKAQRAKPFWDLSALVRLDGARTLLDLGCGTGELTARLLPKLQLESVLGIDSSANMLEKAKAFEGAHVRFQQASIPEFRPEKPFDIIFSNAALQWVPEHRTLFPKLISWLAPKGQMALQMPANFDHPSHVLAGEIAAEMGVSPRTSPVLSIEEYSILLHTHGLEDPRVRKEVYLHALPSGAEVFEWTKGTLLTDYEKRMTPETFEAFKTRYKERLLKVIGEGPYLYTFKRILLWGRRA